MSKAAELLKNNPLVSAWRVQENAAKSYELFFVHRKLETLRATDTVDTQVTVYVDHDGKRGDSSFSVSPAMTEKDISAKIDTAVRRAKLVYNEPYELPQGGTLNEELPSNMKEEDPKNLGKRIADAVFAADTVEGGSINACEIFLYQDTLRVMNSRGVDKTQRKTRVMIEAIPTFTEGNESVELYEDYRFTDFDPERVTKEISARMAEVRDRFKAKKPGVPMSIDVLLRPQEIWELLSEFAADADYSAVYSHANLHKVGDDLQAGGAGDKLTFTLKALLPGCERSAFFDSDGAALHDTRILHNGVVENNFGSTRFGQYLGIKEPSGALPYCISAETGSLTEEEIKRQPYIECVSMSGIQVDLYNDYIGGEIRLAYYYDGQTTIPITGITMSAKLSQVLASLRLSEKKVLQASYEGPAYLLMPNVSIL